MNPNITSEVIQGKVIMMAICTCAVYYIKSRKSTRNKFEKVNIYVSQVNKRNICGVGLLITFKN